MSAKSKELKKPRGGARPGAGMPKGYKTAKTLAKEEAREVARTLITQHLAPMIEAQVANALGIKYLVTRQKSTGKFIRVTEAMAKARQDLQDDEEIIEVWEKDPSVQAFTDLLNRAIDKPKEQAQELDVNLNMEALFARLDRGRERNAKRKGE